MSPNELSALTPIAKKLNEKSNEINETLALVNSKLAAMNVGVEAWLGPWEEKSSAYQIGYAKASDTEKWQLATRTCEAQTDDDRFGEWIAVPGSYGPARPVLQASRDLRIETLERLPEIIEYLASLVDAKLEIIEQAKKIAADL